LQTKAEQDIRSQRKARLSATEDATPKALPISQSDAELCSWLRTGLLPRHMGGSCGLLVAGPLRSDRLHRERTMNAGEQSSCCPPVMVLYHKLQLAIQALFGLRSHSPPSTDHGKETWLLGSVFVPPTHKSHSMHVSARPSRSSPSYSTAKTTYRAFDAAATGSHSQPRRQHAAPMHRSRSSPSHPSFRT